MEDRLVQLQKELIEGQKLSMQGSMQNEGGFCDCEVLMNVVD